MEYTLAIDTLYKNFETRGLASKPEVDKEVVSQIIREAVYDTSNRDFIEAFEQNQEIADVVVYNLEFVVSTEYLSDWIDEILGE